MFPIASRDRDPIFLAPTEKDLYVMFVPLQKDGMGWGGGNVDHAGSVIGVVVDRRGLQQWRLKRGGAEII